MPTMQTALSSMNMAFSPQGVADAAPDTVDAFQPGPDTGFVDALRRHPGVDLDDSVYEYLAGWPSALQRVVQAVIWENFTRQATVPITFAWTPGYDYSVTVHDVADTDTSAGGITITFTSRYPSDRHPLGRVSAS